MASRTGHIELELKFTGAPETLAALPDAPFFASLPGKVRWSRLESTYFDTADGALAARGLSLRLRIEDGCAWQTVKRKTAGAVGRAEWETPLPDKAAFPLPVGDSEIDLFIESTRETLAAQHTVITDRWCKVAKLKGAKIEVAIDVGRGVSADGVATPVGEVELELLKGDPALLFKMGRELLKAEPLRLTPKSKLQTVEAALRGMAHAVPPRARLEAGPQTTAEALLAMSLAASAERLAALAPLVTQMRLPEGLHQMRVELRRLRAIIAAFGAAPKGRVLKKLRAEAKRMARRLGPARDWDVFIDETLARVGDYAPAADGMAHFAKRAGRARAKAWSKAHDAVADPAFQLFLLRLMRAAELRPWRSKKLRAPATRFAARILDATYDEASRRAATRNASPPASLHALRIALKRHRYAAQNFRALYGKSARGDHMVALGRLQDGLGRLNDLAVARRLLAKARKKGGRAAIRAAGFVEGYHAALAENALRAIDADWSALQNSPRFWQDES